MIQSVERAIAILRCFEDKEALGVTEISEQLGLHKSTCFGLINTLKKEKLLQQEDNGRLRLGIGLFHLGNNFKVDLKEMYAPVLNDLLASTKETVNLVVRDDDSIVYIEKKESPHSMRICTSIGKRLPLYCTATGKAILAFLQAQEIQEILAGTKFAAYTEHTVVSGAALAEQLSMIRKEGCAYDLEELEYGLVCVAVPILDKKDKPMGGISVSGPSIRMTEEKRKEIKVLLMEKVMRLE